MAFQLRTIPTNPNGRHADFLRLLVVGGYLFGAQFHTRIIVPQITGNNALCGLARERVKDAPFNGTEPTIGNLTKNGVEYTCTCRGNVHSGGHRPAGERHIFLAKFGIFTLHQILSERAPKSIPNPIRLRGLNMTQFLGLPFMVMNGKGRFPPA